MYFLSAFRLVISLMERFDLRQDDGSNPLEDFSHWKVSGYRYTQWQVTSLSIGFRCKKWTQNVLIEFYSQEIDQKDQKEILKYFSRALIGFVE